MWLILHTVQLTVSAVLPTVCRLQLTSCPRPILDFSKGKNKCSKGSDEHFKGGSEPKVIMIIFYHFPKSSTRIDLPRKHKLCSDKKQHIRATK